MEISVLQKTSKDLALKYQSVSHTSEFCAEMESFRVQADVTSKTSLVLYQITRVEKIEMNDC